MSGLKGKSGIYPIEKRRGLFPKGHKTNAGKHWKDRFTKRGKQTLKHRINISNSVRGEKNHNWKGGISPIHKRIRMSLEYRLWKTAVFERDNFTCIWCGIKEKIEVDHIKPFVLFLELRFAIDNGRTLCQECHRTTDTYGGKIQKLLI